MRNRTERTMTFSTLPIGELVRAIAKSDLDLDLGSRAHPVASAREWGRLSELRKVESTEKLPIPTTSCGLRISSHTIQGPSDPGRSLPSIGSSELRAIRPLALGHLAAPTRFL